MPEHADLPSLFIGSSSEGLDIAREVELQLQNYAITTIWKDGVFRPGEAVLESLMRALEDFDFAVLVLRPDDLVDTRGFTFTSPRDNVLFELGLFMGRLGRFRTFILSEYGKDLKIPSDLAGITRSTYRLRDNLGAAISPACTPIIRTVRELGRLQRSEPAVTVPDVERMVQHILNYLTANEFNMVGFDRIRQRINPKYTDEMLFDLIDRFPQRFRRVKMAGNKQGVGLVDRV